MSMTLEYSPSTSYVHGAYEPITFITSSTEQAGGTFFKFKYVADIYLSNLDSPYAYVKQARIFIEPNTEGAGVFRVDKIISDYLEITSGDSSTSSAGFISNSIHTLGANTTTKIWVNNEGQNYRKVKINYGQSYATAADLAPTVSIDLSDIFYISCIMSAGKQMLPTWDEGGNYLVTGNDYLVNFCPRDSTKKALSDRPTTTQYTSTLASNVSVINQDLTNNEWRTLGILMDDLAPVESDALSFYVALFDSSDSVLDAGFFSAGTDGGTVPSLSNQDYERLQFVGVGARNLNAQTIDTGFTTHFTAGTVAYYEVFFMDDSTTVPSNATTTSMASLCYRFTIKNASCIYGTGTGKTKYNYVTLAWQNSLGAWDYQSFALKHQRKTSNIERKTFDQVAGNWNTAKSGVQFAYRGDEGGVTTTQISARQTMVANTELYNEAEVDFLENLWLSPKVQLLNYDGSAIPITITDKEWVRKNNLNEGGAFTYQIKFEYGKQRPTVR